MAAAVLSDSSGGAYSGGRIVGGFVRLVGNDMVCAFHDVQPDELRRRVAVPAAQCLQQGIMLLVRHLMRACHMRAAIERTP